MIIKKISIINNWREENLFELLKERGVVQEQITSGRFLGFRMGIMESTEKNTNLLILYIFRANSEFEIDYAKKLIEGSDGVIFYDEVPKWYFPKQVTIRVSNIDDLIEGIRRIDSGIYES